jgi:tRNA (guanine-N7-)-methyltransferase
VTPTGQQPYNRTVVSFVHRGGRMTAGQFRSWERNWPRLGRLLHELPPGPLDTDVWFGRHAPVVLEIGSGMGETTAQLAAAAPEVNYLAVEVYQPGLAQLMMRAEALGLTNLRLVRGDAVVLLAEHMLPGSLVEVRIFFPDPWPKKKHHKRRLVRPEFIDLVASRLTQRGLLRLATDWAPYAEEMMAACTAEPRLRNVYPQAPGGWAPRPEWRAVTKFEAQAGAQGRISRDLVFERFDH